MKRLSTLCMLAAIVPQSAWAGWNSGGTGELISDATNPWFVQNTTRVGYCIDMDERNFGQERAVAGAKIKAAFVYWQREFAKTPPLIREGVDVRLGTQEFYETSCPVKGPSRSEGFIIFRLGRLPAEEAWAIGRPKRTVAVALRQTYDPRQLRGTGSVYVSPEKGPLALEGPENGPQIMPKRWQYEGGKLLELVLIHELGHVFGIQHVQDTIMDSAAPDFLIKLPMAKLIRDELPNPPFLLSKGRLDGRFGLSAKTEDAASILGLPERWLAAELTSSDGNDLVLTAAPSSQERPIQLGKFLPERPTRVVRYSPLAFLYLPPEQVAFREKNASGGRIVTIQYPSHMTWQLAYESAGKKRARRHVSFDVTPAKLSVTGVRDDGLISPSFLILHNWPARSP